MTKKKPKVARKKKPKVMHESELGPGIHPICQRCYFDRTLEGRLRAPVEMNFPYCGGNACCFCGGSDGGYATRGIYMKAKAGEAKHCRGYHGSDAPSRLHTLSKRNYEAYAENAEAVRDKSISG